MRGTGQTGVTRALGMSKNPRVNSPKSNSRFPDSLHGLAQDFRDSSNTSWELHSQDLVHQNLIIEMNRRNPTKNASNPREEKTTKSSPFAHGLGREIKGKRTTRGSCIHPHQIPNSKTSNPAHENRQEKVSKTKEKWEIHNKALRNHAESSIHTMKVHTRCLPPNHPSLSQDLTMKLSS
jgi:hypothetical protein